MSIEPRVLLDLPPGPFEVQTNGTNEHSGFVYLLDKNMRKIGTTWGPWKQKAALAEFIVEARDKIDVLCKLQHPQYLMYINDKPEFMSLREAGVAFDSSFEDVRVGKLVLMPDLSLREITKEEERTISDIADEHSANK